MNTLFKFFISLSLLLGGLFLAPMAMAMPGAGAVKTMDASRLLNAPARLGEPALTPDESSIRGLVKQAGLRIHIGYGYYPRRYSRRYYRYPRYGYSPRYRYKRHYRRYPRYRPYRYRTHRYKRRLKKRRALRRLRRLLRHGYYY